MHCTRLLNSTKDIFAHDDLPEKEFTSSVELLLGRSLRSFNSRTPLQDGEELRITILVFEESGLLHFITHLDKMPRPPEVAIVEVHGAPRNHASTKDTKWVR